MWPFNKTQPRPNYILFNVETSGSAELIHKTFFVARTWSFSLVFKVYTNPSEVRFFRESCLPPALDPLPLELAIADVGITSSTSPTCELPTPIDKFSPPLVLSSESPPRFAVVTGSSPNSSMTDRTPCPGAARKPPKERFGSFPPTPVATFPDECLCSQIRIWRRNRAVKRPDSLSWCHCNCRTINQLISDIHRERGN